MWDLNEAAAVSDGDESLDDDWDIDSDEEREKKAQKEKEEQQRKDEAKSIKQKIKEKEEAERLKREARIAELNRQKTEAEKAKEQEDAQLSIAMKDMGLDVPEAMPEDTFLAGDTSTTVPSSISNKDDPNIINFMPKTKDDMTKYADMLAEHCWQKYSHKKDFNFLLEQIVRQLLERHDVEEWEVVKKLGNSVSAIGNEKQKEWKKKNKTGGRKNNTKPKLGGYAKSSGFDDAAPVEDFDDFM